jgi:conjugative transposon TraM protein
MSPVQTEAKQPSQKMLRQRKFFVFLPILLLPFVTFLLWSLGIVGTPKVEAQAQAKKTAGFNMNLPDAQLKDNNWDKLSFYEQADKDSAKYKASLKTDPYYSKLAALSSAGDTSYPVRAETGGYHGPVYDPAPPRLTTQDASEKKVYDKLAALNSALNQSASAKPTATPPGGSLPQQPGVNSQDIDRLENMLNQVSQKGQAPDPEMQDINRVMENILDIQHPERVKDRLQQQSKVNKSQVYPVVVPTQDNISVLSHQGTAKTATTDSVKAVVRTAVAHNGFYSLGDVSLAGDQQNTIEAVVNETQTLVSGATVKLRLLHDVFINGILIP